VSLPLLLDIMYGKTGSLIKRADIVRLLTDRVSVLRPPCIPTTTPFKLECWLADSIIQFTSYNLYVG